MLLSHEMLKVWYWKSLLKRSKQNELINQHACQSLTNYYSINLLNKKTASELYEKIWCFYTERHGKPNWETKNSESNYISHSSFWNSENYVVVLTNNIFPAKCILSCGFQRRFSSSKEKGSEGINHFKW